MEPADFGPAELAIVRERVAAKWRALCGGLPPDLREECVSRVLAVICAAWNAGETIRDLAAYAGTIATHEARTIRKAYRGTVRARIRRLRADEVDSGDDADRCATDAARGTMAGAVLCVDADEGGRDWFDLNVPCGPLWEPGDEQRFRDRVATLARGVVLERAGAWPVEWDRATRAALVRLRDLRRAVLETWVEREIAGRRVSPRELGAVWLAYGGWPERTKVTEDLTPGTVIEAARESFKKAKSRGIRTCPQPVTVSGP